MDKQQISPDTAEWLARQAGAMPGPAGVAPSLATAGADEITRWLVENIKHLANACSEVMEVSWRDRAVGLVSALVPALVELRDLSSATRRLDVLDYLAIDRMLPFDSYLALAYHPSLGEETKKGLLAFLGTLPGFDLAASHQQSAVFFNAYQLPQMYLHGLMLELDRKAIAGQPMDTPPFIYVDGMGDCTRAQSWMGRLPGGHRAYHYGRVVVSRARRLGKAAGRWVVHQLREIRGEITREMRPPVKVRRHGTTALSISVRPEFGGELVVLPLGTLHEVSLRTPGARSLTVKAEVSGREASEDSERPRYEVHIKRLDGTPLILGPFPDAQVAAEAMDRIRRPLMGVGGTGRWVMAGLVVPQLVFLLAVWAWFAHRVPATGEGLASVSAADSAAPAPTTAGLMALFAGAKPGQEQAPGVPSSLAAALGGSAGKPPAGFDLADDIYNEAMAKAKASMHEQGPPQSLAPDAGLKGFGLSGGATGAGCDPKLAFKVSP